MVVKTAVHIWELHIHLKEIQSEAIHTVKLQIQHNLKPYTL